MEFLTAPKTPADFINAIMYRAVQHHLRRASRGAYCLAQDVWSEALLTEMGRRRWRRE